MWRYSKAEHNRQFAIAPEEDGTAFVADRPRFRGVALYIAHHSDDTSARAFLVRAQADAWLRRSEGRIESIAAYLERTGRGKPPAPRRRSSDEISVRVAKLRELSPLWEMYKDGVDLSTIQWAAH